MTTSTTTTAFDTLRRDSGAILDELRDAGADVTRPAAMCCPFHDDTRPSSGVYEADDGAWRFKCHGCGFNGDVADVRAKATGRNVADVIRELSPRTTPPRTAAKPSRMFATIEAMVDSVRRVDTHYRYTNPDTGRVELVTIRHRDTPDGSKSFLQGGPTLDGRWVMRRPAGMLPLYNRARVRDAEHVIVVEGEKCVHALHDIGFVATTSSGGAGKAALTDWSMMAGKTVTLWADNDPASEKGERKGIAHMREVVRILEQLEPPCTLRWVDPDTLDLPSKGDVADVIDRCDDATEAREVVETIIDSAESLGASRDLWAMIRDTGTGRRRAIPFPWPVVSTLSRAMLPRTLTVLCGEPGSAKSLMAIEMVAHWHDEGVPVAILEMEDAHADHLARAFCQRCGDVRVLDDGHVRDHFADVESSYQQHQPWLDAFGRCIHEQPPGTPMTLADVADWIEQQAIAGKRIIVVDPITAAITKENRWIEDQVFVMRAKQIAEQFEVSILILTHPHKNSGGRRTMDSVAGGTCYTRFAQTVMWLSSHRPPEDVTVIHRSAFGTRREAVDADRILTLSKTRNANGAGLQIAFTLDGDSLRFRELGVVVSQ